MMEARFRYRSTNEMSSEEKNVDVLNKLKDIAWLWNTYPSNISLSSSGESSTFSLNPHLNFGMSGQLSYSFRHGNEMLDKAMFDDILILKFDESEINYAQFSGEVFEKICSAFDSYRASIIVDLDLDMDDYEEIVEQSQETNKDTDGRDSVFRFQPINFFDKLLCQRSFGLSPEEIKDKLDGEVERVSLKNNGILIIATTELVDRENLLSLNDHLFSLLE